MQEFLRVGYYAQTEYEDELLRENPPDTPDIDKCVAFPPLDPSTFELISRGVCLLTEPLARASAAGCVQVWVATQRDVIACRLVRRVIDDKPRVTRFQNRFDGPESDDDAQEEAPEAEDDLVVGGEDDAEQDGGVANREEEEDGDEEEEADDDDMKADL